MPMLGVVDPSIDTSPGELPVWYPQDRLLATAHRADPSWSAWPFELIYAALDEHVGLRFSAGTRFQGPPFDWP